MNHPPLDWSKRSQGDWNGIDSKLEQPSGFSAGPLSPNMRRLGLGEETHSSSGHIAVVFWQSLTRTLTS